eukprot:4228483-Lingulodinium_polyedra.AAC.1
MGAKSSFHKKLAQRSPFQSVALREVGTLAFDTPDLPKDVKTQQLATMATQVFSGFGQSKVVEDSLNRLRNVEERASKGKVLSLVRQYGILRDESICNLHKRPELDPPA